MESNNLEGSKLLKINLVIISDIRLYREGLASVLESENEFSVVTTCNCSANISAYLQNSLQNDIMDLLLVDMVNTNCKDVLRSILNLPLKKIALAVNETESEVISCAEAGFAGYVSRDASIKDLINAVCATAHGELVCPPKIAGSLLRKVTALSGNQYDCANEKRITHREMQIAKLINKGFSNKEIAKELCIEVSTVKNHVHNILEKLQIRRRSEVATKLQILLPAVVH